MSGKHKWPRLIFVAGTDTGVGKTLVTALLLSHLRQKGEHAFAIKPFCSGNRADAEIFCELQQGDLSIDRVNPYFFPVPVAPLVAARLEGTRITLGQTVEYIQGIAESLSSDKEASLLIEGAGGLLSPLGEGFDLNDLIAACSKRAETRVWRPEIKVILVSANRLGTLNHTLLTVRALKKRDITIVLNEVSPLRNEAPDRVYNADILRELLAGIEVMRVPWMGMRKVSAKLIRDRAKRMKADLEMVLDGRVQCLTRS
jgi:dethiobiotin synthase